MGRRTIIVSDKWYKKLLWILVDKLILIVCAFIVLGLLSAVDFSYYTLQEKLTGKEVMNIE